MVDELGAILNKYEVPFGLMNKLMMLSEYQVLEFMIGTSINLIELIIGMDSSIQYCLGRSQAQRFHFFLGMILTFCIFIHSFNLFQTTLVA